MSDGVELVQARGGEVVVLYPGDVVWGPSVRSTGTAPAPTSSWSTPPIGTASQTGAGPPGAPVTDEGYGYPGLDDV